MDIEKQKRSELISHLGGEFYCIEECRVRFVGRNDDLRADVVAISKSEVEPWVLAFEVKEPTERWELKNWLNALRQAGNYPNCEVVDERLSGLNNKLINASFIYPAPNLMIWKDQDSRNTRFYRDYDREPLRGAILLAQHFKVGTTNFDVASGEFSLKLGTDPIWDNRVGFRNKSNSLLAKRRIGSLMRPLYSEK